MISSGSCHHKWDSHKIFIIILQATHKHICDYEPFNIEQKFWLIWATSASVGNSICYQQYLDLILRGPARVTFYHCCLCISFDVVLYQCGIYFRTSLDGEMEETHGTEIPLLIWITSGFLLHIFPLFSCSPNQPLWSNQTLCDPTRFLVALWKV